MAKTTTTLSPTENSQFITQGKPYKNSSNGTMCHPILFWKY